jgi:predicted DNA-binding transcriptional regulator AlpA
MCRDEQQRLARPLKRYSDLEITMTESSTNEEPRRMLNEKQVLDIVPVSAVTLWRLEKAGTFPRSSYVSPNRRCWFQDEVVAWQNDISGRRRGHQNRPKIAPKAENRPEG